MTTSEETFENEVDRLAALQDLDCQLKEKEDLAASLDEEASGFEDRLQKDRDALAEMEGEQRTLDSKRRDLEGRLEDEGGKIRDNRMRQNRVRNEREVLALQREIDISKDVNRQLEEELLAVLERLEVLGEELAAAKQTVADLEAQMPEQVTARRTQSREILAQLSEQRSRRAALVNGMNPGLRNKYEQIFQRRGGSAVVLARHGVCTGCHMNVPPQMFNELQKCRDFRQCPNCHRILFFRPEPES